MLIYIKFIIKNIFLIDKNYEYILSTFKVVKTKNHNKINSVMVFTIYNTFLNF